MDILITLDIWLSFPSSSFSDSSLKNYFKEEENICTKKQYSKNAKKTKHRVHIQIDLNYKFKTSMPLVSWSFKSGNPPKLLYLEIVMSMLNSQTPKKMKKMR